MPSAEISQQIDERLDALYRKHLPIEADSIASYYGSGRGYYAPALAGEEQDHFGISIVTVDGELHHAGNHELPFALQSLSKVFAYGLALQDRGRERVLKEVGVEPSGDAFNSIVFDERNSRPYNPMVNAGALAATQLVAGSDPAEKLERILQTLRSYAANERLEVHRQTFEQEVLTADRNRATAYLMRSDAMITGDVEAILAVYLRQCSVHVNCGDLAVMAATLANGGLNPITGEQSLRRDCVRDVLSVMYTCGMYDFAGEWAYQVGVPAKSGVSGGIMCAIPGKLGIGVFSPGLDSYGNSVRGVRVCEEISQHLGLHVFATDAEDAMLGQSSPEDA
ncbi:MAG: glutaminase A [Solirubrobacterales bacterium]|nr:glutaminase A [Solirubrobacterales bacterium]